MLGERGAEEGAAELHGAGAMVGGDPAGGVEVDAVELGLARAAGGDVTEVRLVAKAADAAAGAGTEGAAVLDGGADEAGQARRGLGERVGRRRVVRRPPSGPTPRTPLMMATLGGTPSKASSRR